MGWTVWDVCRTALTLKGRVSLEGTTITLRKLTVRQFAVCGSSPQLAPLPQLRSIFQFTANPSALPYRNLYLLLLILLLCLLPINTCLLYLLIRWGKPMHVRPHCSFCVVGSSFPEAFRVWRKGDCASLCVIVRLCSFFIVFKVGPSTSYSSL